MGALDLSKPAESQSHPAMGRPSLPTYPRGEVEVLVPFLGRGEIMKTIPDLAREILSRSPTPALPLPRLMEAIEQESTGPVNGVERVLGEIRSRPDLFRVLDPHIGPWRRATTEPGDSPPWSPDTWVLGLVPGPRTVSPVRARTAESLRCLGRRVDENSATSIARWLILIERCA